MKDRLRTSLLSVGVAVFCRLIVRLMCSQRKLAPPARIHSYTVTLLPSLLLQLPSAYTHSSIHWKFGEFLGGVAFTCLSTSCEGRHSIFHQLTHAAPYADNLWNILGRVAFILLSVSCEGRHSLWLEVCLDFDWQLKTFLLVRKIGPWNFK